jgi:branched-chain amino acid transport system substrate-binding protein
VKQPMYKYVFKTPQNDSDCARKIYEDCKAKGYAKVALVTVTTGFGQAGQIELQKLAPEFGITIVADETYPKDATDLTPILTKIKAKKPQAIVHWSIEPVQGLIAGQIKSLKMDAQLYQSHGFGNKKYITPEAEGVLFPAGRLLVVDDLDSTHVQYALLKKFKADYEAKYGEEVSTFAGHSYDALLLVQAALNAGGTERAAIRDGLEGVSSLVGTAGVYTMKADDHCGLGSDAFVMVTVKDGKFRQAGAVKQMAAGK